MLSSMVDKTTRKDVAEYICGRLATAYPGDDHGIISRFVEQNVVLLAAPGLPWTMESRWYAAEEALDRYKIHRLNPLTRGVTHAGTPPTSIEVLVRGPAPPDLPDIVFRRMRWRQRLMARALQTWRRTWQAITDRWRKLAG